MAHCAAADLDLPRGSTSPQAVRVSRRRATADGAMSISDLDRLLGGLPAFADSSSESEEEPEPEPSEAAAAMAATVDTEQVEDFCPSCPLFVVRTKPTSARIEGRD